MSITTFEDVYKVKDIKTDPKKLTESEKQIIYRDARANGTYDQIWQNTGKCVFCDLREKYILFEENGVVMTISLYAYVDGHFLIIPRRHVNSPKELTSKEWDTFRKFMYIAKKMIKKTYGIDSMQVVYKDGVNAQSTVGHIHFHCIPFDDPELSKWNYKEMKFTPLENAAKYKAKRVDFFKYKKKFESEYANRSALPIVCDIIIKNKNDQYLLQERAEKYKFEPDNMTLPGGHCDNFNITLEENLAKEVKEETNFEIDITKLKLVASELSEVKWKSTSAHMKVKYTEQHKFLWNTYLYIGNVDPKGMKAGDDCEQLVWLTLDEIKKSDKISKESKDRIIKASQNN